MRSLDGLKATPNRPPTPNATVLASTHKSHSFMIPPVPLALGQSPMLTLSTLNMCSNVNRVNIHGTVGEPLD